LFHFELINVGIIIFGHAHLHSRTDSPALPAEYCGHSTQYSHLVLIIIDNDLLHF